MKEMSMEYDDMSKWHAQPGLCAHITSLAFWHDILLLIGSCDVLLGLCFDKLRM